MKVFGFSEAEISTLFQVLASVLHLGNVDFVDDSASLCSVKNSKDVRVVANLLQVNYDELSKVLTNRVTAVGSSKYQTGCSAQISRDTRDMLAKNLYSSLFDWIVERTNLALNKATERCVSLLDIFGFEHSDDNNFEQLCINYSTEMLQQFFYSTAFVKVASLYEREAMGVIELRFDINDGIIASFDNPFHGIFPLLDEELKLPKSTDTRWLQKCASRNAGNKIFAARGPKSMKMRDDQFSIKHYVGSVVYTCDGMVQKNKDELHGNLIEFMSKSESEFIRSLFEKVAYSKSQDSASVGSASVTKRGSSHLKTLSLSFRNQMKALLDKLEKTNSYFIQCIRPNNKMKAMDFDRRLCLSQMKSSGIVSALELCS
jgi:myosin heavy subunit